MFSLLCFQNKISCFICLLICPVLICISFILSRFQNKNSDFLTQISFFPHPDTIGEPSSSRRYFTRSQGRTMSNFEDVQSMATEQALREQNQLLRKQLEDMNSQMQTLMAQLQGNMAAQSSQNSQKAQAQNQEHVVQPPAQNTTQINFPPQEPAYYPPKGSTTEICYSNRPNRAIYLSN
jgi:hypothetical protein